MGEIRIHDLDEVCIKAGVTRLPPFQSTIGKLVDGELVEVSTKEQQLMERVRAAGEPLPAEYRGCVYLGKLVTPDENGEVPQSDIQDFTDLYNVLLKWELIRYAQLAPFMFLSLAPGLNGERRGMILVYPFSDHSRERLNEYVGFEAFTDEGGMPVEWPENWMPEEPRFSQEGELV